jgi:hypothetical protein
VMCSGGGACTLLLLFWEVWSLLLTGVPVILEALGCTIVPSSRVWTVTCSAFCSTVHVWGWKACRIHSACACSFCRPLGPWLGPRLLVLIWYSVIPSTGDDAFCILTVVCILYIVFVEAELVGEAVSSICL